MYHNFGPTLACIDMWILKLHDDLVERIDRPERITLADGLTIGRGGCSDILLDSKEFPGLISRLHASVTVNAEGGVILHSLGSELVWFRPRNTVSASVPP